MTDTFGFGSVRFAFTDRTGGTSVAPYDSLNLGDRVGDTRDAVAENRRRVAAAIGLPAQRLVFMRQVHGVDVAIVDRPWETAASLQVDALVTTSPDLALAVLVADCFPLLLGDDLAGVVAAAHVGRRGLAGGLVDRVVSVMVSLGAGLERIRAGIGPGICGSCYEVPPAMHDEIVAAVPEASSRTPRDTPAVDIHAGIHGQLIRAGLTQSSNVRCSSRCTFEDGALFSHRRQRPTGRLAGVAWRSSTPADRLLLPESA